MRKRLVSILLCVLALFLLLPATVWAQSPEATKASTLHVSYQNGEEPLVGAQFDLFLVGTVDAYGDVTSAEGFAGLDISIQDKTADDWRALATTLEGYVAMQDLLPFSAGLTGEDGVVSFAQLPAGLYFVCGHRLTLEDVSYDTEPFMVRLPHYDTVTGQYLDEVTVSPKRYIPDGNPITRKVLKVWDDNNNEASRPTEVVVHLLCNDQVYDTVTLSAENNWRYTWENLNGYQRWSVVEDVPTNYTVEITREGITFVVRNTYVAPPPPPPPHLPQTGQLWWPVPVLAAAGLLLMVAGLLRRRGDYDEA